MPFDRFEDFEAITEERTKALKQSLRLLSAEELRKIGEEIFHYPDDPWRARLLQLIAEKPHGSFYHGVTHDQVTFLYCPDEDIGLWSLAGSGMGPLQETGKRIMKEAIAQHH